MSRTKDTLNGHGTFEDRALAAMTEWHPWETCPPTARRITIFAMDRESREFIVLEGMTRAAGGGWVHEYTPAHLQTDLRKRYAYLLWSKVKMPTYAAVSAALEAGKPEKSDETRLNPAG
jgi:hypothetical protein